VYSIKCKICNKNKLLARYSNNQLKKYREQIYFQGALKAERPNCQECTGTPKLELQCADCRVYKSLEDFSKNSRVKDRDNAVSTPSTPILRHADCYQLCWDCQQKVSDVEPNVEDAIREEEIMEEYKTKGSSVSLQVLTFGLESL
jgi:Stc1 domain